MNRYRIPPVTVAIEEKGTKEIVIVISDDGGGMNPSQMKHIWNYLYTTADPNIQKSFLLVDDCDDEITDASTTKNNRSATLSSSQKDDKKDYHSNETPIAGLGYGLPIARAYCRYFGGDLRMLSRRGYGTDVFIYVKRFGDALPPMS
jgi:pyruvate dehydrogenase kinase 2/3/4